MNNPERTELDNIIDISSQVNSLLSEHPRLQRLAANWEPITWIVGGSLFAVGFGIAGGPGWPLINAPETPYLGIVLMEGGASVIIASYVAAYVAVKLGSLFLKGLEDHHQNSHGHIMK